MSILTWLIQCSSKTLGLSPFCSCGGALQVNWAYENGTALQIMDPNMGAYPSEALEPFIRLALDCCKEKTEDRPSMAEVVRDLEYIWQYAHDSESDDFELDSKDYQACKISNANKSRMEQFNLSANSICRDTSIENDSIHFRDPVGIVVAFVSALRLQGKENCPQRVVRNKSMPSYDAPMFQLAMAHLQYFTAVRAPMSLQAPMKSCAGRFY
eukprot:Gb_07662 [translate_table: standard]